MTNTMTVADLRFLIAQLPDDTQVWVFSDQDFTFTPVMHAVHDKRVNGLNLWISPENPVSA